MADSRIAISSLGTDRACYINKPSIPPPVCVFTCWDCEGDEDISKFLHLYHNTDCKLAEVLAGTHICSDCDFVCNLPKTLDYSSGKKEDQVYLTLHRSAVKRILVFNKTDVEYIKFFTPYAYSETVSRPVVFMLVDPATVYEAQSIFSVDVNFGIQSEILNFMNDFLSTRKQEPLPGLVSLLCKMIVMYRSRADVVAISAVVIDMLLTWRISIAVAAQVWSFIGSSVSVLLESFCSSGFKGQVNTEFFEVLLKPLVTIVTCLSAVMGTTLMPNQKQIDSVLNRMGNIGKALNGYKSIVTAFQDVIDKVFNTVYEVIFGVPYTKDALETFLEGLREWYDDASELASLDNQDKLVIDYRLCRRVEQLHVRGQEYMRRMREMNLSRAQMDPFHGYWRIVSKLYDRCIAQGSRRSEPRTEPVVIHLFGKSGVGKSGLTYLLAQDLLVLEGLQESVQDEVYFRNVEQEFWDGYHGQAIVVYDDFGQKRDTESSPNPEFMEIIRSGNIAPWPLHMAHLEEKARTRFTSRACILTSNERVYDMGSLTHKDAIDRRKEICAEVLLKPQFTTHKGRLDTSKVADVLSSDVYEFVLFEDDQPLCHIVDGCTEPIKYNYVDFVQLCQQLYVKKFCQSKARLECLKARGQKLTSTREALLTKYRAQVDDDDVFYQEKQLLLRDSSPYISADAIAFPYVWLTVNNDPHTGKLAPDIFIDEVLIDELKALAVVSRDYTDFQMKARLCCNEYGYNFAQKFAKNEEKQKNLLRVYAAKASYYGKRFLSGAINAVSQTFDMLRYEFVSYWHHLLNGDLIANITLFYYCSLILGAWATKRMVDAECAALGVQPVLVEPAQPKPDESDSIVGEVNGKDKDVICFSCFKPGHYASHCLIDQSIKRRRDAYYRKDDSHAESRDNISRKTKPIVAESRQEYIKRPRNQVVAESRDVYTRVPKKQVVGEVNLRPHYPDSQPEIPDETPYTAEALIDTNAGELITTVIPRNVYSIATFKDNTWIPRVNLVFVHGRCAIMVAHAVPFLNTKVKIQNQYNPQGMTFSFEELTFIPLSNSLGEELDCVLVVFPSYVPSHRSLLKNFVRVEDLSSFSSVPGNLYTVRKDDGLFSRIQFSLTKIEAIDTESYITTPENRVRRWVLRRGYSYHAETHNGDCTGVLVASSGSLQRKILGIHVAGAPLGKALAQSVTQDMLRKAIDQVPFSAQLHVEYDDSIVETHDPDLPEGDFIPVGKLIRPVGTSGKSNLTESPIYGLVKEPTTAPAVLRPFKDGDRVIDPMLKGLKKCGTPNGMINLALARRCVKSVFAKFNKNVRPVHVATLTHEQSITGIDGEEFIAPINRRSSPGYPWCDQRQGKMGKTKWLGDDATYILDDPSVLEAVETRIASAKEGILRPTLWTDTLKDERRTLAKVAEGKTRVFSAGSMDYILAFRRYYLGFFAYMMENRINNGSAVGINPYSIEWHHLATRLVTKGSHVVAGDFSNFDGSLMASVLHMILEEIIDWKFKYATEFGLETDFDSEEKVMRVLFEDIINSTHIRGDNVYKWTHSQPSGNPGTVIINTLFNETMFRYVFSEITKLPMMHFDKHVNFVAYGDDNCANISADVIDSFNQESITSAFSAIGLTYTDEQKSGNCVRYRTLDEISFLKRKFKFDDYFKRYVAPLDLDTILEMTMWVRGNVDIHQRCKTNVDLAYQELAIHGEQVFDKWSKHLDSLCRHNLDSPPTLYDYIDYKECEMEKWC